MLIYAVKYKMYHLILIKKYLAFQNDLRHTKFISDKPTVSGRSSGVEHNLAKVRVVSSNLIARSSFY